MSEGLILAIDQGTTGTKVILFDHAGEVVKLAYGELTQHYPQPGWVEHDPREIWDSTLALVAEAISDAGCEPQDIKAIGVTNQRETTVLWDRVSGQPVAPAIVWQDR